MVFPDARVLACRGIGNDRWGAAMRYITIIVTVVASAFAGGDAGAQFSMGDHGGGMANPLNDTFTPSQNSSSKMGGSSTSDTGAKKSKKTTTRKTGKELKTPQGGGSKMAVPQGGGNKMAVPKGNAGGLKTPGKQETGKQIETGKTETGKGTSKTDTGPDIGKAGAGPQIESGKAPEIERKPGGTGTASTPGTTTTPGETGKGTGTASTPGPATTPGDTGKQIESGKQIETGKATTPGTATTPGETGKGPATASGDSGKGIATKPDDKKVDGPSMYAAPDNKKTDGPSMYAAPEQKQATRPEPQPQPGPRPVTPPITPPPTTTAKTDDGLVHSGGIGDPRFPHTQTRDPADNPPPPPPPDPTPGPRAAVYEGWTWLSCSACEDRCKKANQTNACMVPSKRNETETIAREFMIIPPGDTWRKVNTTWDNCAKVTCKAGGRECCSFNEWQTGGASTEWRRLGPAGGRYVVVNEVPCNCGAFFEMLEALNVAPAVDKSKEMDSLKANYCPGLTAENVRGLAKACNLKGKFDLAMRPDPQELINLVMDLAGGFNDSFRDHPNPNPTGGMPGEAVPTPPSSAAGPNTSFDR